MMDMTEVATLEVGAATSVAESPCNSCCRRTAFGSVMAATTALAWATHKYNRSCTHSCFTVAADALKCRHTGVGSAAIAAVAGSSIATQNIFTADSCNRQATAATVLVSTMLANQVARRRRDKRAHEQLHAFGGRGGGGQWNSVGAAQQDRMREMKRNREAGQFFAYQKQLKEMGLPPRDNIFWDREEQMTFGGSKITQGINFDNYDRIDVTRRGGRKKEQVCTSFPELCQSFDLPQELVRNIERCGYNTPTPVQKHAMPAALVGTDVMVSAQTGSGKTAAFLVPSIASTLQVGPTPLQEGPVCPSCIILAPTRELCQQITVEARKLCFLSAAHVVSVYGGADAMPQLRDMAEGCEIIVATPGRLEDFLGRGVLSMKHVRRLVLDEAHRMLDMGFEPQIRSIIEAHGMPPPGPTEHDRQTMMFSATFPREMQELALDFLDPTYLWISVGRVGSATENVEQRFKDVSMVGIEGRFQTLLQSVNDVKPQTGQQAKTLVFANAKAVVDDVAWQLSDQRVRTTQIHGGLSQAARNRALSDFKNGRVSVLVATDVAARGLDLPGVDHVINYELPLNSEDYVHRIGRTGRIGNTGVATSMVTDFEPALKGIVSAIKGHDKKEGCDSNLPTWVEAQAMRNSSAPVNRFSARGRGRSGFRSLSPMGGRGGYREGGYDRNQGGFDRGGSVPAGYGQGGSHRPGTLQRGFVPTHYDGEDGDQGRFDRRGSDRNIRFSRNFDSSDRDFKSWNRRKSQGDGRERSYGDNVGRLRGRSRDPPWMR